MSSMVIVVASNISSFSHPVTWTECTIDIYRSDIPLTDIILSFFFYVLNFNKLINIIKIIIPVTWLEDKDTTV